MDMVGPNLDFLTILFTWRKSQHMHLHSKALERLVSLAYRL